MRSVSAATDGFTLDGAAPGPDGTGRHERADAPTAAASEAVSEALGVPTPGRTTITLRPLASPLPLGLFAFSIGSFLLGLSQLGVFAVQEQTTVYLMCAVFVAVPQFLASVMAFLAREPIVATLLGLLAVSWPTQYAVALSSGSPTSGPRGALFLALGVTLLLLAVPGLTAKPLVSALVVVASLRFVAGGLYDLTSTTGWERVSGSLALVVVLLGGYLAVALVYEDVRHRTVLPVGRRGESRTAMEGGLAEQERSLPQEAGVRAQL